MSEPTPPPAVLFSRVHDRFGLGPRRDSSGLDRSGPDRSELTDPASARRALLEQLRLGPESADERYPGGQSLPTSEQLLERQRQGRAQRRRGQDEEPDREAFRARIRQSRALLQKEAVELLGHRAWTARPFMERWVAFWSNHLCVSTADPTVVPWAGHYERHAIRPNVLGHYADLVLASARHPAMLLYLDNIRSIGPGSRAARFSRQRRREQGDDPGLNENYARELLELHTVGVDGGYDQRDVEELALILTGWTLESVADRGRQGAMGGRRMGQGRTAGRRGPGGRAGGPGQGDGSRGAGRGGRPSLGDLSFEAAIEPGAHGFAFVGLLHEPGARTVMGRRFDQEGSAQGVAAIEYLATHERTARFLANKLVRHFVADEPPASAVDRVAAVFRRTSGDLRAVAEAVVDLPEAWDPRYRKMRTPQDWLVALLRAAGVRECPQFGVEALRRLRQPVWGPQAPNGYGDTAQDWSDSASLMSRAELARSLASSPLGMRVTADSVLAAIDAGDPDPDDPSLLRLRQLLEDESVPKNERLALVLASPSFQWR